ncbi:hypothetical protein LCM02_07250 [Lutimonas saemankumensis]|uniref:hypothetical protein n=1 Tax=Lutimonas saemankumensis TaxID=483016 RepID=UPI001CD2FD58|nr:hypothetical protein [Lutimonas saemankumensis]MCA0932241.1 hypothetical protein [Lutimonas saemankumensis]
MKKILLLSTPVLLVILFGFKSAHTRSIIGEEVPPELLGSWEYLAPNIGLKYQRGAINFSYANNELKGVVLMNSEEIPMKGLIYEDNKVRAHILIHGEKLDIFLRFETDSFKGTVSHPQGYLRISGSKTSG